MPELILYLLLIVNTIFVDGTFYCLDPEFSKKIEVAINETDAEEANKVIQAETNRIKQNMDARGYKICLDEARSKCEALAVGARFQTAITHCRLIETYLSELSNSDNAYSAKNRLVLCVSVIVMTAYSVRVNFRL